MQQHMKDAGVQGFAMTVLTQDATEGKAYAIQCAGLGPLTPNTVLMGWPWWWKSDPAKHVPEFLSTIHQATLRQKALLVCHNVKDFPKNDEPQVCAISPHLPRVHGLLCCGWASSTGGGSPKSHAFPHLLTPDRDFSHLPTPPHTSPHLPTPPLPSRRWASSTCGGSSTTAASSSSSHTSSRSTACGAAAGCAST